MSSSMSMPEVEAVKSSIGSFKSLMSAVPLRVKFPPGSEAEAPGMLTTLLLNLTGRSISPNLIPEYPAFSAFN